LETAPQGATALRRFAARAACAAALCIGHVAIRPEQGLCERAPEGAFRQAGRRASCGLVEHLLLTQELAHLASLDEEVQAGHWLDPSFRPDGTGAGCGEQVALHGYPSELHLVAIAAQRLGVVHCGFAG